MTDKNDWKPMDTSPIDGTTIIGKYDDVECAIFWSDRPVCMAGPRLGGCPAGWATDGDDVDYNLPMDAPEAWRLEK